MGIAVLGMDLGKNVCSLVGIVAMQDLLWSPSSRSVVRRARTRGAADVAGIRQALCEGAEERRPRRGRDRRGGDETDHAVRRLEERAQLDMQTLHRSRDRSMGERTVLINQLRAILLERGLAAAGQAQA